MADIEKNDIEDTEAEKVTDTPAEEAGGKAKAKDAKADKMAKSKKSDKPSVFKRIGAWFKSCKSEMKKIVWASPKTVLNNSITVIVTVVAVGLAIALLDYIFSAAIVGLSGII